jgi:septum formation protein
MVNIILASSSVNRKSLLDRLKMPYTAITPDVDETRLPGESGHAMALRLSIAKAEKIAKDHPSALVIGSDQAAICQDILIEKPITIENAVAQWKLLSNAEVIFYTGLCVMYQGQLLTHVDEAHVQFKPLTEARIRRYLDLDDPLSCCGGLRIESLGIALTRQVRSNDPTALIGLPLIALVDILEALGLDPIAL